MGRGSGSGSSAKGGGGAATMTGTDQEPLPVFEDSTTTIPKEKRGMNTTADVEFEGGAKAKYKPQELEDDLAQKMIGGTQAWREVAAFKLDRELGLGIVPFTDWHAAEIFGSPTVGSAQRFVEGRTVGGNAKTEKQYQKERAIFKRVIEKARGRRDVAHMAVLDFIMQNGDRRLPNTIFNPKTGRVRAIDNGFAMFKDRVHMRGEVPPGRDGRKTLHSPREGSVHPLALASYKKAPARSLLSRSAQEKIKSLAKMSTKNLARHLSRTLEGNSPDGPGRRALIGAALRVKEVARALAKGRPIPTGFRDNRGRLVKGADLATGTRGRRILMRLNPAVKAGINQGRFSIGRILEAQRRKLARKRAAEAPTLRL